jgi:hypothetical protein
MTPACPPSRRALEPASRDAAGTETNRIGRSSKSVWLWREGSQPGRARAGRFPRSRRLCDARLGGRLVLLERAGHRGPPQSASAQPTCARRAPAVDRRACARSDTTAGCRPQRERRAARHDGRGRDQLCGSFVGHARRPGGRVCCGDALDPAGRVSFAPACFHTCVRLATTFRFRSGS